MRCSTVLIASANGPGFSIFTDTSAAAKRSAIIYSIIESAKENGLNPFEYLKYLREQIPQRPIAQLEDILPQVRGVTLPSDCHVPSRATENA